MEKITIIALTTLIIGTAQASYIINVPLESDKGGTLPSNSIIIKQMNSEAPTENWGPYASLYGSWINNLAPYDCSNWSPSPSTIAVGQSFTQTATDCKQDQIRTVQQREIEQLSLAIRNVGSETTENQSITTTSTRQSTGALETWIATAPSYTNWIDSGVPYDCSNWNPSPATVDLGQSFTQTATDCKQDQTRTRQDREQETTTLDYRNVGSVSNENHYVTSSSTRSSTGTRPLPDCKYDFAGSPGYMWFVDTNVAQQDTLWWNLTWANYTPIRAPRNSTTFTHNGSTYQRGAVTNTVAGGVYYQICKLN